MKDERTLTALRNNLKGRIYIYLDNKEICRRFLQDAEAEGYRFGKILPTESDGDNIIALGKNYQLSYVGFVGRIAFQCNGGDHNGGFYRIDYRKFVNGAKDYLYSESPTLRVKEFSGKFYDTVTVIGENYPDASDFIKTHLAECQTAEDEEALYSATSEQFHVLVIEE